jgi:nitrile hydratase accessory protein
MNDGGRATERGRHEDASKNHGSRGGRGVNSPSDPAAPGLPRDGDSPVFRAPWEAQAFALAVALHERGAFTWKEWAATLAEMIAEAAARGEPDTGERYYEHWLAALERIAAAKRLVDGAGLDRRRRQWEDAARRTPHGQPIVLESDA